MKIRSFIALEFPTSIQNEILLRTTILRQNYPNPIIRWVKSGNIHLTLKFLGDQPLSLLEIITRTLTQEVSHIVKFSVSFNRLGIFPNPHKPRIIWIGVNSPAILGELQKKIEFLTSKHGIQNEHRPFSPHLTLGRITNRNSFLDIEKLNEEIRSIDVSSINSANISSIMIFKSELKPDGPIYTAIHKIELGG